MSKYRDKLQIVANILSIAQKRARKTQIMYQANLSYKLLCRYLSEVQDAGLVSHEINKEYYMLTPKGREFLAKHEEYSKRCKSLEEHLEHVNKEKLTLQEMCLNSNTRTNDSSNRPPRKRIERKIAS